MIELLVFILSVVVSLFVGAFVFMRDPRRKVNQIYGLLTLSFVSFGVANYLSLTSLDHMLLYVRMTVLATTIMTTALYFLVIALQAKRRPLLSSRFNQLVLGFTVVIACLDVSPWVFSGIAHSATTLVPVPALGAALFLIHFVLLVAISLTILFKGVMQSKGLIRSQYTYILIGMSPTLLFAPITGVLLPVFYEHTEYIFLSPLYVAFFVSMIAYAMIKHRLFDIKYAAIRTAVYIGILTTLGVIYYSLAYGASFILSDGSAGRISTANPTSVLIALFLGVLFQPIKRFFDKLTNNIFYRDIYSSEDFLNRLSATLTSTTDLKALLRRAAVEIGTTLKSEQAFFIVYRDNDRYIQAGTDAHSKMTLEEARELDGFARRDGINLVSTKSLKENHPVRKLLSNHEVELLLPLTIEHNVVGYLALGEQRTGGYADRDTKILSTVSNELVIAIQNALSVQAVKGLNDTLQQRIDEATKELRASNAQLQKLDEAKDEFVSMASHQLRTPLTSVKGYISMVLEEDAGKISDAQRHLLNEAFTSSERMVHLINDFLNVSRLQTGKFMVDRRAIDLAKITGQEVDSLKTTAGARNLKLRYRKPSYFPTLYIDEGKIRQVIMNFIDNAIYYSSEFSTITIALEQVNGEAILTVHNEGIGVPESEKTHLFTKFFRAANARKQRPDGTGVGLYLSKMVVTAHSGKMVFDSAPNEGTTFGFRLPIKKLSTAPIESAD
jgi:signal transduction histidine kinase